MTKKSLDIVKNTSIFQSLPVNKQTEIEYTYKIIVNGYSGVCSYGRVWHKGEFITKLSIKEKQKLTEELVEEMLAHPLLYKNRPLYHPHEGLLRDENRNC